MSDSQTTASAIKNPPSLHFPMPHPTTDVKTSQVPAPQTKWNTKNLIPRLATDATAAAASAVTVAPLITIIDK